LNRWGRHVGPRFAQARSAGSTRTPPSGEGTERSQYLSAYATRLHAFSPRRSQNGQRAPAPPRAQGRSDQAADSPGRRTHWDEAARRVLSAFKMRSCGPTRGGRSSQQS
jgi:hypothetical protein